MFGVECVTFERCDHAWTALLQETLQLLPGPLQDRVELDVATEVTVVLFEETEPGLSSLQPVNTAHTQTQTHFTESNQQSINEPITDADLLFPCRDV